MFLVFVKFQIPIALFQNYQERPDVASTEVFVLREKMHAFHDFIFGIALPIVVG
jgi:hypothetical protein